MSLYDEIPRPDLNLPTVELEGCRVPVLDHLDARVLREVLKEGSDLDMQTFHSCNTVHCLGGWQIHLCGSQGYELADEAGEFKASRLIYEASCPGKEVPSFSGCASHQDAKKYNAWHLELLEKRAAEDPLPTAEDYLNAMV